MSFRINRVYTRSGDDGTTALIGGVRVPKSSLRVEVYGEVDELNATLGLVIATLSEKLTPLKNSLLLIQQELFDLGSELARVPAADSPPWTITNKHSERLEQQCDNFGQGLPELTSFILPGGTDSIARLHLARTVCRRVERRLVALSEKEVVNPASVIYINRLSDLLFIGARYAHKEEGVSEVLWDLNPHRLG